MQVAEWGAKLAAREAAAKAELAAREVAVQVELASAAAAVREVVAARAQAEASQRTAARARTEILKADLLSMIDRPRPQAQPTPTAHTHTRSPVAPLPDVSGDVLDELERELLELGSPAAVAEEKEAPLAEQLAASYDEAAVRGTGVGGSEPGPVSEVAAAAAAALVQLGPFSEHQLGSVTAAVEVDVAHRSRDDWLADPYVEAVAAVAARLRSDMAAEVDALRAASAAKADMRVEMLQARHQKALAGDPHLAHR